MNDTRDCPEAELREALHREAGRLAVGPAPVEAVVRAGRVRRRRNRAAAGGTAALTGLVAFTVLAGLPQPFGPPQPERVKPAVSAPASPSQAGAGVRTVAPYEPVPLGPDLRLGLLPEGRQNYVVAEAAQFSASLAQARAARGGDSLRPRSISAAYSSTEREGVQRVTGSWRLPKPPRRIVVSVAGTHHPAGLYTLPDHPGWGVYHLDTAGLPRFTSFTVTAYDEDGEVFATRTVETSPRGFGEAGP